MRTRGVLAAAIVGAALMTAGCGRELDDAEVATTAPSLTLSSEQQAAVRASRALTKDGSPASVVMTFLQDLRDGAGPALFGVYDSRIPDRIGRRDMLGALKVMSGVAAGTQPVVIRHRNTSAGELVVVRLLRTEGSDSRYSFLLRRDGKRWTIVYDGLIAQGLESFVTGRIAGGSSKPSAQASRAGARAVSDLQLATLEPQPGNRPKASNRSGQSSGSATSSSGTTTGTGTETTPGG